MNTHKIIFFLWLGYILLFNLQAQDSTILRKKVPFAEIDSIIKYGKTFIGKPYRYKDIGIRTLDCSGFLSHIFLKYNYLLPHSAKKIAETTKNISVADLRKGDLLFFSGRKSSKAIAHAGIVVEANKTSIKMLHSCERGIVIDNFLSSAYYKKKFLKAGRLKQFIQIQSTKNINIIDSSTIARNNIRKPDLVYIVGVGDMMLGTLFPSASYLPPNPEVSLFEPVKDILQQANITFGNLEGVLLSGEGKVKKCKDPTTCYAFKSPDSFINYYKDAGFDILSLANNHVDDFGDEGRNNTVRLLSENNIQFAGLLSYPSTVFEKDGIKYGFCAFAPNSGTVSINDLAHAAEIVKKLDFECDIVIVSFHGGAEGSSKRHITRENELFLGENRGNPHKFARVVIDSGADIVFGHGPHVTRAIDLYKNRFIAYSLGNFATYARFNLKGVCGLAPIVRLVVNNRGEFITGKIISTKQLGEGGPVLDENQLALKEIITLTKEDVPESPLSIGKDGEINLK